MFSRVSFLMEVKLEIDKHKIQRVVGDVTSQNNSPNCRKLSFVMGSLYHSCIPDILFVCTI